MYDSWGNTIAVYDANGQIVNSETHLAVQNPIRYRGYYWDSETGLYYLQSRYYDPVVGRFISADSSSVVSATLMGLTDKNLYTYCDNNPVVRADSGGGFWHIVAGGAIGFATSFITTIVTGTMTGEYENINDAAQAAVLSGVFGLVTGALVAAVPQCTVLINTISGATESVASDLLSKDPINAKTIVTNAVVSAGFGALAGSQGSSFSGKGKDIVNDGGKSLCGKMKSLLKKETVHPKVKKSQNDMIKQGTKFVKKQFKSGLGFDGAMSLLKEGVKRFSNAFVKALFR